MDDNRILWVFYLWRLQKLGDGRLLRHKLRTYKENSSFHRPQSYALLIIEKIITSRGLVLQNININPYLHYTPLLFMIQLNSLFILFIHLLKAD